MATRAVRSGSFERSISPLSLCQRRSSTNPASSESTIDRRLAQSPSAAHGSRGAARITLPETDTTHPELERIWALARIKDLQEQIEDGGRRGLLRRAIVDLGTTYSIVSDHTSMIVVREEQFEQRSIDRKNKSRVEAERDAREVRIRQYAPDPRADAAQPMFPGKSGGSLGGGFLGAAGPETLGLLAALLGARAALRRRARGRDVGP